MVSVPFSFSGSMRAKQFEKRCGAEAISHGGACKFSVAEIEEAAANGNRTQNIDARFANFVGGECADVDIHLVEIIRFRRVRASGREMHGQTRNDAIDPAARCRPDFYRLRGVQLIEHRRQAALRQPLNAQVAIVGDRADNKTGLVNSGDEQPMRSAAAKCDNDVANIVDLRMKRREPRTELIDKRFFVPRNRGHIVKRFQVVEAGFARSDFMRRLRAGRPRAREKAKGTQIWRCTEKSSGSPSEPNGLAKRLTRDASLRNDLNAGLFCCRTQRLVQCR